MEQDQTTSSFVAPEPMPKKSRKKLFIIIAAVALGLLTIFGIIFVLAGKDNNDFIEPIATVSESQESIEDTNTIRMLATGDWIAHDAINKYAKITGEGYDYLSMTTDMQAYFKENDINFCNQATLAGGEQFGVTGYPIFNAPLEWIRDMKGLGCDIINTGTNHTNDISQAPITAQLNEWDKQNVLAVAGSNRSTEEQNRVRYFEVKGIKFALLSYSTYSNAPNPNPYSLNRFTDELVVPQMQEATMQADVVIVSMRWGTEYSPSINAAQDKHAQKLSDLGADIVLGHGPHVLEPVKRLTGASGNETVVWYSLGNFLNAQLETEALTGCVATFTYDVPNKKLVDSACMPFYQHYEWTAEDKAAERLLTRSNFRIMPLYKADEWLKKSQLDTTVKAQMERIRAIVNTYTEILVLDSDAL